MILIIFILLIIAVFSIGINHHSPRNHQFLLFFCVVLAIYSGFRPQVSDTVFYTYSFLKTPILSDFSWEARVPGYNEKGYYFLCSIIRTLTDSQEIYLLVIGSLSIYFLYKALDDKMALLPVLGLLIYLCRFMAGRNFTQMRAGLAIAIIMFSIKFVKERKFWLFLITWFVAYNFHRSMLVALPLYFMDVIKLKKWHVITIIAIAYILGISFTTFLHGFIQDAEADMNLGIGKYIEGGEKRFIESTGFANPMIYYQTIILLVYTFMEDKIRKLTSHYDLIRTGYLLSTFLLITLCSYKVLSGRTSTIFATFEIFIIPQLAIAFSKKKNALTLIATVAVMIFFFYNNYREYLNLLSI